ncbi:hypothetical protein HK28_00530 [Acetobacter sp. DsW_063]|nr:hypothetical protein HK28_00530 [Acetobacter sp. DsW_063]
MRRLARQREHDASDMALRLIGLAVARAEQLEALQRSYVTELDDLRRDRWRASEAVAQVQAEAIAARLIVHELDARLGEPPREFHPLPDFPFPQRAPDVRAITMEDHKDA